MRNINFFLNLVILLFACLPVFSQEIISICINPNKVQIEYQEDLLPTIVTYKGDTYKEGVLIVKKYLCGDEKNVSVCELSEEEMEDFITKKGVVAFIAENNLPIEPRKENGKLKSKKELIKDIKKYCDDK